MKNLHILWIFSLIVVSGCKKDKENLQNPASINVVNAAIGLGSIKLHSGIDDHFTWAKIPDEVPYGSNFSYDSFVGNRSVSIVSTSDTTRKIIQTTLNLKSIQTLYLIGQYPDIDTMFREETNLPFIMAAKLDPDSSVYIRFVNLSPDSQKIRVNIESTPAQDEVTNLGFKGVSTFKKYTAKGTASDYTFEIRDVVSNALIMSYTFYINQNRYKTVSLVLRGLISGTGADAVSISSVNYF